MTSGTISISHATVLCIRADLSIRQVRTARGSTTIRSEYATKGVYRTRSATRHSNTRTEASRTVRIISPRIIVLPNNVWRCIISARISSPASLSPTSTDIMSSACMAPKPVPASTSHVQTSSLCSVHSDSLARSLFRCSYTTLTTRARLSALPFVAKYCVLFHNPQLVRYCLFYQGNNIHVDTKHLFRILVEYESFHTY